MEIVCGNFYLARVYLRKPDGHLYNDMSYKIRPVLVIGVKGNCIECLPVTSKINYFPASVNGRVRIDIGPRYVNRPSQIICNKTTLILKDKILRYISTCEAEDYAIILEKYKELKGN